MDYSLDVYHIIHTTYAFVVGGWCHIRSHSEANSHLTGEAYPTHIQESDHVSDQSDKTGTLEPVSLIPPTTVTMCKSVIQNMNYYLLRQE